MKTFTTNWRNTRNRLCISIITRWFYLLWKDVGFTIFMLIKPHQNENSADGWIIIASLNDHRQDHIIVYKRQSQTTLKSRNRVCWVKNRGRFDSRPIYHFSHPLSSVSLKTVSQRSADILESHIWNRLRTPMWSVKSCRIMFEYLNKYPDFWLFLHLKNQLLKTAQLLRQVWWWWYIS